MRLLSLFLLDQEVVARSVLIRHREDSPSKLFEPVEHERQVDVDVVERAEWVLWVNAVDADLVDAFDVRPLVTHFLLFLIIFMFVLSFFLLIVVVVVVAAFIAFLFEFEGLLHLEGFDAFDNGRVDHTREFRVGVVMLDDLEGRWYGVFDLARASVWVRVLDH